MSSTCCVEVKKLESAKSSRVIEAQELAEWLSKNGLHSFSAIRTSVECVYGMVERYHRHNYSHIGREAQNDHVWDDLADKMWVEPGCGER